MILNYEKLPCSTINDFPHKGFSSHSCIVYQDDLYLFSGQTSNKMILSCVFKYNFQNQTWENMFKDIKGGIPPPIRCHTCSIYENFVYLFGGENRRGPLKEMYSFDLEDLRWKHFNVEEKPPIRYGHVSTTYKDKIFIFGGFHKEDLQLNDSWFFDVKKNTWEELITDIAPCPRRYSSIAKYQDSLFLFGGHDNVNRLNDLWEFDCITLRWKEIKNFGKIPTLRSACSVVIYGDSLFMFGGMDGEKKNDLFELDLVNYHWKEIEIYKKETIPEARYWHIASLYKGEMYIHGGWVDKDQNECYDDFYKIPLTKKSLNQKKSFYKALLSRSYIDCLFIWNE